MFASDYYLYIQISCNALSVKDSTDELFEIFPQGSLSQETIIEEIVDTLGGDSNYIKRALLKEKQIIKRALLMGKRVSNELFSAKILCRGLVSDGRWNPNVNSLYVNFQQSKELREALDNLSIRVIGEKQETRYISSCRSLSAERKEGKIVAGDSVEILGKNIKVGGSHSSVGIELIHENGNNIRIAEGKIVVNRPSKLIVLLPDNLEEGTYALMITTQYSRGSTLLKNPKIIKRVIDVITE